MRALNALQLPFTVVALLATLASFGLIFFHAPVEQTMGIVQKIFYTHVPSALATYAGFTVTSICSLLYLLKPHRTWDLAARSGAEVGMIFCIYVFISGPLWAWKAWGKPWTWDPQLTATFVLFLLYGGYLLLRTLSPDDASIRKASAVLAIVAFVDIPIIHYAVRKWGGLHPVVEREGGAGLAPDIKLVFTFSTFAFLLLFIALLWARLRTRQLQRRVDALHLEIADLSHELP
jgi:heme exporter protein C